MRASTHKTLRDLRRNGAQVVAVAITVALGVALFIASAGAFRNLSDSYQYTYDRLHFADLVATGGDTPQVAAAARSNGAAAVSTRTQADRPLLIEGTKLIGRVVGMPAAGRPDVDDVDLLAGEYLSPDDPDGVLVERHASDTFGLGVGDTVRVYTGAGWRVATVRGIVVSAEYIWPARSRQEVFGDPHAFAVLFASESTAQQWTGEGPNQVLATLPATAQDEGTSKIADAMRRAGAADVTRQDEQASHATLQEDLDGFRELAVAFPLLFLTAAAAAAYVLLARRVLAERPIIATLMAGGARRGRIVRHYLQQGVLIGLIGSVVGVALGILGTAGVTTGYTDALGIPDTIVSRHLDLALAGLAFGIVVGIAGAAAPALTAARTVPAAAMRSGSPARRSGWWSRLVARLLWLPVTARMALRDVFRSRRRTLATVLGTTLALVLVLASVGMLTSLSAAINLTFDQIQRQDATVTVATGEAKDTRARLAGMSGVSAVESATVTRVTAARDGQTYSTVLNGFQPSTNMHGFRSEDGDWLRLPTDGVLAGASLADELDVAPGDTLNLSAPDGSITRVRLVGLLDEPVGTALYATNRVASGVVGDATLATFLVRFHDSADRDAMRRTITQLPGVVAYADAEAVTSLIDQYLGLFWAFVGTMVLLGAILALAIIYVTMAVNVVERTNELATLRAAGISRRRVAGTLATENALATVLGIPIGLALGVLAAQWFLDSFSSDLFRFDLILGWWTLPTAMAGVLLAAAVSLLPAVRAVGRLDVARVVRERAI